MTMYPNLRWAIVSASVTVGLLATGPAPAAPDDKAPEFKAMSLRPGEIGPERHG